MNSLLKSPAVQIWLVIAVIIVCLGGLGWEWHNAHACIRRPQSSYATHEMNR